MHHRDRFKCTALGAEVKRRGMQVGVEPGDHLPLSIGRYFLPFLPANTREESGRRSRAQRRRIVKDA
jgi:hypothetical protein